ncbi:hypothetical protein Hte_007307 [Hypoxylon texense]
MPTYVTREVYACSHSAETRHQTFGTDSSVVTDTIPNPLHCLSCACQAVSNIITPYDTEKTANRKLTTVAAPHMREISTHLELMLADKQWCTTGTGTCSTTRRVYGRPNLKTAGNLKALRRKILRPVDLIEFSTALYTLSLFSETDCPDTW